MVKKMAEGGAVTQPDPNDSNEWEKIKNWISGKEAAPGDKRPRELLHMDEGGEVPDDPAKRELMDFIAPAGSGTLAPSPASPPPPVSPISASAPAPAAAAPLPIAPATPLPGATDADFEAKADKILGTSPEARKALFSHLQKSDMWAQIPALLAGFGDSIARSYGKDSGANHMGDLEKSLGEQDKNILENSDAVAKIGKERYEVGQTLEARDFSSPLSKQLQRTYGPLLLKTGFKQPDIDKMSASNIADLTGKSVDVLKAEAEASMAAASLGLKTVEANSSIAHQRQEEENARKGRKLEATKALAGRGIVDKAAGLIPGTTSNTVRKSLENDMNGTSGPVPVNSRAEYDALPAGTHYVDSYGKEKVKK